MHWKLKLGIAAALFVSACSIGIQQLLAGSPIDRCRNQLETARELRAEGADGEALRLIDRSLDRLQTESSDPEARDVLCDLHVERTKLVFKPGTGSRPVEELRFAADVLQSIGMSCSEHFAREQIGYLCKSLGDIHRELYDLAACVVFGGSVLG